MYHQDQSATISISISITDNQHVVLLTQLAFDTGSISIESALLQQQMNLLQSGVEGGGRSHLLQPSSCAYMYNQKQSASGTSSHYPICHQQS